MALGRDRRVTQRVFYPPSEGSAGKSNLEKEMGPRLLKVSVRACPHFDPQRCGGRGGGGGWQEADALRWACESTHSDLCPLGTRVQSWRRYECWMALGVQVRASDSQQWK